MDVPDRNLSDALNISVVAGLQTLDGSGNAAVKISCTGIYSCTDTNLDMARAPWWDHTLRTCSRDYKPSGGVSSKSNPTQRFLESHDLMPVVSINACGPKAIQWRAGVQGGIQLQNIVVVVALGRVALGSWQPHLTHMPSPPPA